MIYSSYKRSPNRGNVFMHKFYTALPKLSYGDTIGIISPSHVAAKERYEPIIQQIETLGFQAKISNNLYSNTYGYIASEYERADDLNSMVSDPDVRMIFFGGGYGSVDLLPLIDYENIRKNPKLFLSYSDGTSILNAIHTRTGLVTYYGQTPGDYAAPVPYTIEQFKRNFLEKSTGEFIPNSTWHTVQQGTCEGILIGGYLHNIVLGLGGPYFSYDKTKTYLLFLEDHERFSSVAEVSSLLSFLEQSDFIKCVGGLIFGNYADMLSYPLLERLERFCKKHSIPAVYTDDFGHGRNHAVLPIGCYSKLNATNKTLFFY